MIELVIRPPPHTLKLNSTILEEIVIRSIGEYLKRPGHVSLPEGMISHEEFEKERNNSLFRVQKFWEYWHGSRTLSSKRRRKVSLVTNGSFSHTQT
jgi:hypothetical protein